MKYTSSKPPEQCFMRQSDWYRNEGGTTTIKGVLWHCTGANNPNLKRYVQPDDNATDKQYWLDKLGVNTNGNDWNHSKGNGIHAWIGKLADGSVTTVQVGPWNKVAWGCGQGNHGSCNNGWVQFEICEDGLSDKNYFDAVYREACELTAYLCKIYGLNPFGTIEFSGVKVPVILCHQDSYKLGLGSNHSDVYNWFNRFGKTMDDVRKDVNAILTGNPINIITNNLGYNVYNSTVNPINNSLTTKIMSTEEKIWYFLVEKIGNKYGAAGLMGNLMAESALNPINVENSYESQVGGDQLYTDRVNSGAVDREKFIHPNVINSKGKTSSFGYGLAQWTYWSRRRDLYDFIKRTVQPFNIGSLDGQLNFIIEELTTNPEYASVWNVLKTATSTDIACDAVMGDYEGPQNPNPKERRAYASQYFAKYSNSSGTYSASTSVPVADALLSIAASQLGQGHTTFTKWASNTESYVHWCMMFVQWCMEKCGISTPYRTFQCQDFYNNTKSLHINPNDMQPGDIVLFHWAGNNENHWNHTGFVESISGDSFTTIEGNTGQSPPGIVKRNTHRKSNFKPFNSDASQEVAFVRISGTGSYFGDAAYAYTSQASNTVGRTLEEIQADWADFHYEQKSVELNYELQREQVTEDITVHAIETIDADANSIRTHSTSLLTTPTHVESPFIILKVGNYTFGSYSASGSFEWRNSSNKVTYPNYMTGIQITKVNGTVNKYVLTMTYQIEAGQDPNLLDKIFGSVGYGTVYISYGDWNAPSFIYKEEEAIITKLTSQIDFSNSRIVYTMYCTSNALALIGGYYNFEGQTAKPSDIIYDMVYSQEGMYHLQEMFPGLKSKTNFSRFIARDDANVELMPKSGIDALSYINYLVSCMSPTTSDPASPIRDGNYYLTICDDISGEFGGTYFKVTKVDTNSGAISINNSDVYEVDIGYPGDTLVTSFKVNEDNSWALLYNYSQEVSSNDYVYNIDAQGNVYSSYSPNITTSSSSYKTTETQRNWWTQMTQFPITATLEIKGLLRPAMLMSYVRINALFYGLRHVSSGLYIITKQVDTVDSRGYRTTLSLQRIAGDLDTITTQTKTITKTITKKVYK